MLLTPIRLLPLSVTTVIPPATYKQRQDALADELIEVSGREKLHRLRRRFPKLRCWLTASASRARWLLVFERPNTGLRHVRSVTPGASVDELSKIVLEVAYA